MRSTTTWINKLDEGYACARCGYQPLYNKTGGIEFSKFCPECGRKVTKVEGWLEGKKKNAGV